MKGHQEKKTRNAINHHPMFYILVAFPYLITVKYRKGLKCLRRHSCQNLDGNWDSKRDFISVV